MAVKEEALEADLAAALHEEELKNFLIIDDQPNSAQIDIKFVKRRHKLNESEKRARIVSSESVVACLVNCGRSNGVNTPCPNACKCYAAFPGGGFEAIMAFRTSLWELPSLETATSHIDLKGALMARKARMLNLLLSSCVRDSTAGPRRMYYLIQGKEVCKHFFKVSK